MRLSPIPKRKPISPKIGEMNGDLKISRIRDFIDYKSNGSKTNRIIIVSECINCGSEMEWNGVSKFRYLKDRKCHCNKDQNGLTFGQKQTTDSYYHSYKCGAKKRNIEWELSKDEFCKLITSNCYYCGNEPIEKTIGHRLQYQRVRSRGHIEDYEVNINGVDRVDSSDGYYIHNCVPCCSSCNLMKNAFSADFFLSHIKKINNYQNFKK